MTNSFFDGVLKITRPIYIAEDMPLLTLMHVGGGYVDGDSYHTEVIVHDSAKLALTTQASTKVYKSRRFGVTQTTNYLLKDSSELFIKQDSLIPYKDANFIQQINVCMSSSAVFFYTDIISPGWSEDGAPFSYHKVVSKMKIMVDGSLAVFDHLLLESKEKLESIMYLEGYTYIGTLFFLHEKMDEACVEALRTKLLSLSENIRFGASILSVKGMVVKILAHRITGIEHVFTECENFIRERLYNGERLEWRKG
ncbi:urease accessory protein UreD [Sutcliffiella halmapala]|uniref:urease accessory protein UreD n=1 Tax=Sutcliffiella halmapala TaxID=79882 RepID=UPI0011161544|nr:urease accessory protein UreD [Sutcliffiella halmapala]